MVNKLGAPLDLGESRDTAIVKILVGFVPMVGPALAEIVGHVDGQLNQRQAYWRDEVTEAINTLLSQSQDQSRLTVEDLIENEAFTSFLLQATPIALRTHQKEKVACLKNALTAVGRPEFTDEDLAFQFLRYIDELAVSHLGILRIIRDNEMAFDRVKSMQDAFEQIKPAAQLDISPLILRTYLRDLDAKGLINAADLEDLPDLASEAKYLALEQSDRRSLQMTELGRRFLIFVARQDMTAIS